MNRFQLFLKFKTFYASSGFGEPPESKIVWDVTEDDIALITWLHENVGSLRDYTYNIPMRGHGWGIHECHEHDKDIEAYAWRKVNHYGPVGKYGYWLQVDDPDKAVLLKLSGILDSRDRGPSWSRASLDYQQ